MINARTGSLATFAAVILAVPTLRADDTTRLLAGTGTLQNPTFAATTNLKGTSTNDADTVPVCCWWKRAWCCSPAVVYSAPVFVAPTYYPLPAPTVAPPPVGGPASYYYPPAASTAVAVAPRLAPISRPAIVVGYQGRYFSGTVALRPGAQITAPAQPAYDGRFEMMPAPRSNDGFRYDGGPVRPVPMPVPDPVTPTDPVPNTVPALHRVMLQQQARPKVTYPAYGEKPATSKPKVIDPFMVRAN